MTRGIIALVFRCKITGGSLATSDETTAFRWASQEHIRELTSEAYAIRVLDALTPASAPSSASATAPPALTTRSPVPLARADAKEGLSRTRLAAKDHGGVPVLAQAGGG
jgi:hypothetical protein